MAWSLNNLDTRLFLDPHQGVFNPSPLLPLTLPTPDILPMICFLAKFPGRKSAFFTRFARLLSLCKQAMLLCSKVVYLPTVLVLLSFLLHNEWNLNLSCYKNFSLVEKNINLFLRQLSGFYINPKKAPKVRS